jgi:hypothetical protein
LRIQLETRHEGKNAALGFGSGTSLIDARENEIIRDYSLPTEKSAQCGIVQIDCE